jgi:UDP-N-acetylmuramoyl-tripeptide--D-alanyl-D-alanine ligase
VLDKALEKGREYLLSSQRPSGDFVYLYDFVVKRERPGVSPVRQAGALWGLALLNRSLVKEEDPARERTAAALSRGFKFFLRHSRLTPAGARYIVYPGTTEGSTGTVALTALALVEYLRSKPPAAEYAAKKEMLDGLLAMLLSLRMESGQFHRGYTHEGGGTGPPSPYFDGESLLALCRAVRYLDAPPRWRELVVASADAMVEAHVVKARREDPDSRRTKGFYQWGSMSFLEIHRGRFVEDDRFARRAVELAHWMIDTHRTLARTLNTAYAHEGLISAWVLARDLSDRASMKKIAGVVEAGLGKLLSWQVGGPVMNEYLRAHPTDDPLAVGGVLNAADEPLLRIDVAQHQMHAVLLAREHLYPQENGDHR